MVLISKKKMPTRFSMPIIALMLINSAVFKFCVAVENDNQNADDKILSLRHLNTSENQKSSELINSYVSSDRDSLSNQKQVSLTITDILLHRHKNETLKSKTETTDVKSPVGSTISNDILENNSKINGSSSKQSAIDILQKLVRNRALVFKHRLQSIINTVLDKDSETNISSTSKLNLVDENSLKNKISVVKEDSVSNTPKTQREGNARQFQFVFHPYLPYGKETMPDEKISIQDVLPVKMVKFIKSMVEDAPWEAMFMKMVRMVVDQFVDKIIEKMFAGKDEEDHEKWRSLDGPVTLSSSIFPSKTIIHRLRRSAEIIFKPPKDSRNDNTFELSNHLLKDGVYKDVEEAGESSWLDLFLDHLFPGEDKDADKIEKLASKNRHKREISNDIEEESDRSKLMRMKLIEQVENLIFTSRFRRAFKDFIKYRIIKRFIQPLLSWRDVTDVAHVDTHDSQNYLKSSHRMEPTSEPWKIFLKPLIGRQENIGNLLRHKRSLRSYSQKKNGNKIDLYQDDQDIQDAKYKKDDDAKRLWQSSPDIKSSYFKTDDCSLRRACNAGRLLSRLPSVEDITVQLRSHVHEPHWDALLWGMKKKRCSKILCNRQRSPKGSNFPWHKPNSKTFYRKHRSSTEEPQDFSNDIDSTTITPSP